MTEQLMIELCRVIWAQDNFQRITELPPNLKETARWAVSVAEAFATGKTLPSGFPVPPWSPKPRPVGKWHEPDRDAVMEGDLK